jgi:23S rRNA pseudouridine1911/1915/1917 synthase
MPFKAPCLYVIMSDRWQNEFSYLMTNQQVEFTVEKTGERLDKLLVSRLSGVSRTQVQGMIKDNRVTVDGVPVKAGVKLRGGETVVVTLPDQPEEKPIVPEDIPLQVVYEDQHLAVIDKPAGMVVHPGMGNESGTLVHAILARWPEIATMDDPDDRKGIVHRLDKDTSGLIVIAKVAPVLAHLMQQFQDRTVEKTYLALLDRTPNTQYGRIEAPIGRDPKQRKRMAVTRDGKKAITEFTVIDDNFRDHAALVEFKPLTGRTHQIRVHAAFIGCPVVGDRVYGFRKQRTRMKRHFLHAAKLAFYHPATGDRLRFESPLPLGLLQLLTKLRA